MNFSERARFSGGSQDIDAPASVDRERDSSSGDDGQRSVGGGLIEFHIRNNAKTQPILRGPTNYKVQFLRWGGGVTYDVRSALPVKRGRFLKVSCERS